jgi:hypothetical protein
VQSAATNAKSKADAHISPCDFDTLRRAVEANEDLKKDVGKVNPRPPGLDNDQI